MASGDEGLPPVFITLANCLGGGFGDKHRRSIVQKLGVIFERSNDVVALNFCTYFSIPVCCSNDGCISEKKDTQISGKVKVY